jgi:(E)-4-hydroxy-3-methylbut-2-enyl-diphosphate synthase
VRKPELIACPTCGRLAIDLEKIIAELEKRLAGKKTPCKISVLGCVVNGPGEAREADIGIAAGNGKGVIFRNGEIVRNVLESEMVDALLEELALWEKEHAEAPAEKSNGRRRLPLVNA